MATLATVATVANNAANNIFARINFMMGLSKHAFLRNKGFPNATPHGFCQGCPPAQTMRSGGDKSCRRFLRRQYGNDGTRHHRYSNSSQQAGQELQKCAIVNQASTEEDSGIHRTSRKHFGIVQRADFNELTPRTLSATRNSGRFTERETALWHEIFDNRTRTQGNDDCDLQRVRGKQAENAVLDGSSERLCRARIRLCSRIETPWVHDFDVLPRSSTDSFVLED